MKSPERPSKLDPFAQEIVAWRSEGKGYRTIANLLKNRKNLNISFVTVARWYNKRNAHVAQRIERAELQIEVTQQVIESEWATQMSEFHGNYRQALEGGDEPAAVAWARLYHDSWKAMMQKVIPTPTPVTLADQTKDQMSVEEFRRLIIGGE